MPERGRVSTIFPRLATALMVALLVTFSSLRLFLRWGLHETEMAASAAPAGRVVVDQLAERAEIARPAPDPIIIRVTLERTASVLDYLEDIGLRPGEAKAWAECFKKAANTGLMNRGHLLTLYRDPETDELRGLRYDLDGQVEVSERNFGEGVLRSSLDLIRYVTRPVGVAFEVKDSFSRAAARNDLPEPIVATLKDAFGSKSSLSTLPSGSTLKLIYQEKVSADGSHRLVGGLEAAQLKIGTKTLDAFAFRDENGQAHLYNSQGVALGPQFLRFPVQFSYISSGFSFHRYHPLLHEYRAHVGVDFAARYGTPVQAVADGRVEAAGWCGELGRCIRIEHPHDVASVYGHLSQISPGIERGSYVHLGQVIGKVGSSGLSTGSHLHFAIQKEGRYVNPLTQTLGIHHTISPRMRSLFERLRDQYLATFAELPELAGHFNVTRQVGSQSSDASQAASATPARLQGRHESFDWSGGTWQTSATVR
jgi:murein DD-endopeptidase MepM/ murein hydrolase activator NlpD